MTATASFRFGKSMTRWFERSGAKVIVGKAGLTELAYREWFVPYGSVYLTTIGYGMGAAYGQCIKRRARGALAQASSASRRPCGCCEVERLGPFLVEGDREGRSLFALANREIDRRLGEVYARPAPVRDGPLRRDHRAHRRARVAPRTILGARVHTAVTCGPAPGERIVPGRTRVIQSEGGNT